MVFPVLSNLPGLKKLKGMFTDPEERIHEFDSKSLKKILEREVQTLLKNREITDLEMVFGETSPKEVYITQEDILTAVKKVERAKYGALAVYGKEIPDDIQKEIRVGAISLIWAEDGAGKKQIAVGSDFIPIEKKIAPLQGKLYNTYNPTDRKLPVFLALLWGTEALPLIQENVIAYLSKANPKAKEILKKSKILQDRHLIYAYPHENIFFLQTIPHSEIDFSSQEAFGGIFYTNYPVARFIMGYKKFHNFIMTPERIYSEASAQRALQNYFERERSVSYD